MQKKLCSVWTVDLTAINGQNLITIEAIKLLKKEFKVSIYEYQSGLGFHFLKFLRNLFSIYLRVILKKNKFIYLVCSRSFLGFLRDFPILILSLMNYRVIVHVHGSDFIYLFKNIILRNIARRLYRNCEIIIPSKHLLNYFEENNFKKIYLCENFISNEILIYEEENNVLVKEKNKKFKVLWNSNIISSKGFFETYNAIKFLNDIKKGNDDIEFIVLGKCIKDTEMNVSKIKNKLNKIQKSSWLKFLNQLNRKKYKKILLSCNIVILPSTYICECQPLAILEAMIYGKHIIVCNTPALKNTIGSYPAMFAKRDKHSIANNIDKCILEDLNNKNKRIKASKEAKLRFSYKRFSYSFLKIISEI